MSSGIFKILSDSKLVRKEYQFVPYEKYSEARIKILGGFLNNEFVYNKSELEAAIKYLEKYTPNIAIYPGSFNPFHIGHYDIVKQAEAIFDEVILLRAQNYEKEKMNKEYKIPEKLKYHQIVTTDKPILDFIRSLPYDVTLIRGLRNATDFQKEKDYQTTLRDFQPNLKIINLFAKPEYSHISSTVTRDVIKNCGENSLEAKKYLL